MLGNLADGCKRNVRAEHVKVSTQFVPSLHMQEKSTENAPLLQLVEQFGLHRPPHRRSFSSVRSAQASRLAKLLQRLLHLGGVLVVEFDGAIFLQLRLDAE
jgi:hypothetical protein